MSPSSVATPRSNALPNSDSDWVDFRATPRIGILTSSIPLNSSVADLVSLIETDMRNRWSEGHPAPLEEYRSLLEQHSVTDTIWLTLIRLELTLQFEAGQTPTISKYEQQFPHLASNLRVVLEELREKFVSPLPTRQVVIGSSELGNHVRRAGRSSQPTLPKIPGYEILEILGRGGMGIVYKARQVGLNRIVALKMILSETHPTEEDHLRFLQEAEAVAALRHPNIVQIFEIGQHDGQPFFSLEYIESGTLASLCGGRPQSAGFAAEIVAALADAVQAAHAKNIVHRDLKPSNILLASDDSEGAPTGKFVPKITDFGLAKRLDGGLDLTATGYAAGTPVYMAPEQVTGDRGTLSPAVDVWALGIILYEMVTGRPPFLGENAVAVMNLVASSTPLLPRQLQPKIPLDLETICLKCLEKSPRKRYSSAAELADDLRRFTAGRAIRARRIGPFEQLRRWTVRNPAVAALLLGIGAALAAGTLIATVFAFRAQSSAADADRQTRLAEQKERFALDNEQKAIEASELAVKARRDAELQKNEANRLKVEAIEKETIRTRELYAADTVIAYHAWQNGQIDFARGFLDSYTPKKPSDPDGRGFEWYYLDRLCHSEIKVDSVFGSIAHSIAVTPDGKRIFLGSADSVATTTVKEAGFDRVPLQGLSGAIQVLHLDPQGERVVLGMSDGKVRIWNAATWKPLHAWQAHTSSVAASAVSPDGKTLATCSGDGRKRGEIFLWDLTSNRLKHSLFTDHRWPKCLAFSSDGKTIVCGNSAGEIFAIDPDAGTIARLISGTFGSINQIGFAPATNHIVAATDAGVVAGYDPRTGKLLHTFRGHMGGVFAIAFHEGGKILASGGIDGLLHIWNYESEELIRSFRGHDGLIGAMQFVPGGSTLVSTGHDGRCHYWKTDESVEYRHVSPDRPQNCPGEIQHAFRSRDGKKLLASYWFGDCAWIDLAQGKSESIQLELPPSKIKLDFELFPDGDTVAVNMRESGLIFRSLTKKTVSILPSLKHRPGNRIKLSRDGKLLVTVPDPKHVCVNRMDGGGEAVTIDFPYYAETIAISSGDDPILAVSTCDGGLHLWDANTGKKIRTVERLPERVHCLCFSSDGRELAGGGIESRLWVWDAKTGVEKFSRRAHNGAILGVDFNANDDRLLTASLDRTAKMFDARTGRELLDLRGHLYPLHYALFATDRDAILTIDPQAFRVWDAADFAIRERERTLIACCPIEKLRAEGTAKAGAELHIAFDLVNRAGRNLKLPDPGKPIDKMRLSVLLEPLGQDPKLGFPTMGPGKYVLSHVKFSIDRDVPAGGRLTNQSLKVSTRLIPPGRYRIHIQKRYEDPQKGLQLLGETSTEVELH